MLYRKKKVGSVLDNYRARRQEGRWLRRQEGRKSPKREQREEERTNRETRSKTIGNTKGEEKKRERDKEERNWLTGKEKERLERDQGPFSS